MHRDDFDEITKMSATGISRRKIVKRIGAGALAAAGAALIGLPRRARADDAEAGLSLDTLAASAAELVAIWHPDLDDPLFVAAHDLFAEATTAAGWTYEQLDDFTARLEGVVGAIIDRGDGSSPPTEEFAETAVRTEADAAVAPVVVIQLPGFLFGRLKKLVDCLKAANARYAACLVGALGNVAFIAVCKERYDKDVIACFKKFITG
jgi:hypothetical protein